MDHVQPGTIVYLHDGKASDAEAFAASVDLLIQALKAEGYRLVTLAGG